jgi:CRISPR system Cascade subunit CasB
MSQPDDRLFVAHLERLADREDRAALAALRRGLGRRPGETLEMYPYVAPYLPWDSTTGREDAYYLVAALFALHPVGWHAPSGSKEPTNLGASLRILQARSPDGAGEVAEDRSSSLERRFIALLNAHADDLQRHLRHIIGLLQSSDSPVAVDWLRLLEDIQRWSSPHRSVQQRWARAFWGGSERQEEPPSGAGHEQGTPATGTTTT